MKQQNNEEIAIVNNDEEVIDNFLKFLDNEIIEAQDEDPGEIERKIFKASLSASTPEQLLGRAMLAAEDMVGEQFNLLGVTIRQSDFDKAFPFYAILEIELPNASGEIVQRNLSTGSRNIVTKCAIAKQRNFLPLKAVTITKATKATKSGFFPLDLQMNL